MAKLSDYVSIKASSKKLVGDDFWLLNLEMVEQQTGRVIEYNRVSADKLDGSIIQFDTDCVLYSKLRPNLNKVVLPEIDGYATSEMLPLRPDTSVLSREYLAEYLRSDHFVTWAISKTAGAKMPRLGSKELLSKELHIPSLEEQAHIVALFQRVAELIDTKKQELELLDELVKSRFIELFEGSNYPFEPLDNNVIEMFIGPFGSSLKNEVFVDEENGFCMVYEQKHAIQKTMDVPTRYVPKSKYEELKRFTILGGDIIVSCRGTIGEIFVVPNDAPMGIMHPSIMKIRLNTEKYNQKFFVFALEQYMDEHSAEAKGSGVKMAVSATVLGQSDFVIPPIDVQDQFAAFVEQSDKSKLAVQNSIAELEELKKSLMQKYFG